MGSRKLGPRLEAVASFIPVGKRVADIGTDHGLLPIYLRQRGISPMVIASDLRPGPLASAKQNARKYGVDKITFRLCAGLDGYHQDEADVVVIAGMSGETIRAILEKAAWDWSGKRLILEANTKHPELLTWLYQNGSHIVEERIPEEHGRYYRVYCAEAGEAPFPRSAYLWGGFRDSPYARKQAALLKGALMGLDTAEDPSDRQRGEEYRLILEDMKDAYHWDDTE